MAEKKGLLLGRYEVGKLLGQGNFAKVYHATNPTTKEEFAIKVLDKEKVFKSDLVVHVKREIAVLRRVRHPNIVRLYEMMATKSKIYFVMEFARGGELFNKVAKGRLQEDVARKYFQQLIGAVAFCHARGVFHRDIKPENLLLDENGDLKVSDFGLSAVADQIRLDGLSHTFCGTPAYLAPEVLLQKGYNPVKADIWSCGVVLFLLMAGYLPFNDRNVMGLYRKICNGEFRCPKWFSSGLVRLVNQMLETSPERRISIAEIMAKRWFKKDFQQIKFYVEGNEFQNFDDIDSPRSTEDESRSSSSEPSTPSTIKRSSSSSSSLAGSETKESGIRRMTSLNAFDIISFSPGFDLSGLFEEREEETRFLSEAPVSMIVSKIEEIASLVSFTVRKKDCKVTLEGMKEGEKGPLRIAAEIFELTPTLVVVEFKKKSGDKMEYEDFCKKELKPRLQDLIHDASASAGNISSDSKVEE